MADQKKDKPQVDVRDLKPNKDAKGGMANRAQGTGGTRQALSGSGRQAQSGTSKSAQ